VLLIDADGELLAAVAGSSPYGEAFAATLADRAHAAAKRGWAQSHGEREAGASGVAAPVANAAGRVLAALALGGPTPRFTPERVAERVRTFAEAGVDLLLLQCSPQLEEMERFAAEVMPLV